MLHPETDKLQAVKQFPVPKIKTQVRSFLGLTGYYCRFIPDYASTAVPLTNFMRKSAPNLVKWDSECNRTFEKLKEFLCSKPVLWSPDFTRKFVLHTDASDFVVGAVLSCFDDEGTDHLRAHFSRSFSPENNTALQLRRNAWQSS